MWTWWLGGKRGVGGEGSFGVLLLLTTATDEPGLGHLSAAFRRFSSSALAVRPHLPRHFSNAVEGRRAFFFVCTEVLCKYVLGSLSKYMST
jgi:hypothetical protein